METKRRRLSFAEEFGLFLMVVGLIAGGASGGTPLPLMFIGFAMFAIGWMLRRR